jgi:hypothetical protein
MIKPKIFKPENIGLGNTSPNLNLTRKMIRSDSSKRHDQRVRVLICPSNRSEEPVHLLQEWGILHIAPGIRSPFDRQLNESKVADDVIKNKRVIEVSSRPIPIFSSSIEIEVSHEKPKIIIFNSQII